MIIDCFHKKLNEKNVSQDPKTTSKNTSRYFHRIPPVAASGNRKYFQTFTSCLCQKVESSDLGKKMYLNGFNSS